MNTELIERCDLLVRNRLALTQAFSLDSTDMVLAVASFYAAKNQKAEVEKMRACQDILKSKVGVLSEFRDSAKLPLLCKMAESADPEACLSAVRNIVDLMKDLRWNDASYKIVAALTIYAHTQPDAYADAVAKMTALYRGMKEQHRWLTSSEDIPFAAMLAVSGLETDALLKEMDNCYELLKETFPAKNAVQSLSHVLAINPTPAADKCHKVEHINALLQERKHKFDATSSLAVLGSLCLLDFPDETIVDEIIEADDYLKKQKSFGDWSLGAKNRRIYAAMLVMNIHMSAVSSEADNLMISVLTDALITAITSELCMLMMMNNMVLATAAVRS